MSEIAIGSGGEVSQPFRRTTALLIVIVGVLAFAAMLVLGAYAPDMRSGKNGGAHALSNAATGFSGLVKLAEETNRSPFVTRDRSQWDREDLLVVTPEFAATDLSELMSARRAKATLFIFPKWLTERNQAKRSWVTARGLLPPSEPQGILAPAYRLKIGRERLPAGTALATLPNHAPPEMRFAAPPVLQTMTGAGFDPIIVDPKGRMVLGRARDGGFYVLADPDLINNHGLATLDRAAAAMAMLDFLNSTDNEGIVFDVTQNGFGATRSPLKLAFDPPFLGVTLVLLVALLLAGYQALVRFGVPLRPERAIAFGKAALVDNAAKLIRKAGREAHFGSRYADMVRDRTAEAIRLSPAMPAGEVEARLDRLPGDTSFSRLADDARSASTRHGMLAAARALHRWQKEYRA